MKLGSSFTATGRDRNRKSVKITTVSTVDLRNRRSVVDSSDGVDKRRRKMRVTAELVEGDVRSGRGENGVRVELLSVRADPSGLAGFHEDLLDCLEERDYCTRVSEFRATVTLITRSERALA